MLRLLCLAVCAFLATANVLKDSCDAGEWEEWSKCRPAIDCTTSQEASWSSRAPSNPALSKIKRDLSMKRKLLANAKLAACRASGGCMDHFIDSIWETQLCVDGMTEAGFECNNVDMLVMINMDDLGYNQSIAPDTMEGRTGSDMWGWRDSDNNEDYVVVGMSGGASFVRVTDPENPVVLAFLPTHTVASNWRDMKVMGHWAYIVAEARDHGIQAFDMHQLRDWNTYQGWLDSTHYVHYDGIGQSHNIVVNEDTGFLFVVGAYYNAGYPNLCDGGFHMVDATGGGDNMVYAGCFGDDGYVHDAECVIYTGPDTRYAGREICFGYNEDSLTIVDVTDKTAAVMLSRSEYSGSQYTHQGWLTEDQSTLLMDDELDEIDTPDKYTKTYMWDVSDLTAPSLMKTCRSHMTSIDHNQYIVKSLSYQSNYQAGLRIQEIDTDIYDLTEIAYFQTTFNETESEFGEGTWSNYPYFINAGEEYPAFVPLSCKEYGMFIVRPNYDAMFQADAKTGVQERTMANCPSKKEKRLC